MDHPQKIKLPVSVLSGLFGNCLFDLQVSVNEPQNALANPSSMHEPASVRILVAADAKTDEIAPAQHIFLDAIMKACKLESKDYAVLTNKASRFKDFLSMHNHFKHKELILFGIEPASIGLPIHFPHFQVQSFQQVSYLSAPPLEKIEADKALKVQLWQSLKQLFPG